MTPDITKAPDRDPTAAAPLHVAPSPHWVAPELTTQRMMMDVLVALIPACAAALFVFQLAAVKQLVICLTGALGAEALFTWMRRRPLSLMDGSALVTGLILALSLPATAPWYVGLIAAVTAMGMGKMVFGGLGMNIFNPAMVGRAFVMIAFAGAMGAPGYVDPHHQIDIMTQATPLNALKQTTVATPLGALFIGAVNGSLGETSVPACLLGGIYLCTRRVAAWQIPAGVLGSVIFFSSLGYLWGDSGHWTPLHELFSGALLFGAFFIATDPVTTPLTPRGKWIFGLGVGSLVILLRKFSGYPEGVMFAVLLMNGVTPLINRWNVPRPFGGS